MISDISDEEFYKYSLITLYFLTPITLLSLLFLTAPYGKHNRPGWGPTIPPPLAWFLMESPTVFLTLLLFPYGSNSHNPRAFILITPFLLHYTHRTFIYPLRLLFLNNHTIIKPGFPVFVAFLGFFFNCLNGYLQARWISHYANLEADTVLLFWLRYSVGVLIFGFGIVVNVWSDNVLIGLKRLGGGYKVPKGGLFELVSVPNYFGEIVEWFGWAVMNWSWSGFGFFFYTCANLVPRGGATHAWYLDKFGEDYPKSRKAVIPFLY